MVRFLSVFLNVVFKSDGKVEMLKKAGNSGGPHKIITWINQPFLLRFFYYNWVKKDFNNHIFLRILFSYYLLLMKKC